MNIRFTILLVVLLVIIGGTVWITQKGGSPDTRETKPWLWKVELDDLDRIAITHEDQGISYRRVGAKWVIEDGDDTPVYQPKWGGKALIVSGPKPARILEETIDDPSRYGLAPPVTTVEVTDRSGQVVGFDLGALTPDGNNQYIRLNDGSLSTLSHVWGEVVARMATEPPYSPPFITVLDIQQVEEIKIAVRGDTETANGSGAEDAEAIYLLTEEEEEWLLIGGDGALVDLDRWGRLTSGLETTAMETDEENVRERLPEFGLDSPKVRLDLRYDGDQQSQYFVGNTVPGSERRYFRAFGEDTLWTVDAEWADLLMTLANDPPVVDMPAANGAR